MHQSGSRAASLDQLLTVDSEAKHKWVARTSLSRLVVQVESVHIAALWNVHGIPATRDRSQRRRQRSRALDLVGVCVTPSICRGGEGGSYHVVDVVTAIYQWYPITQGSILCKGERGGGQAQVL